jgi:hypothetical protein
MEVIFLEKEPEEKWPREDEANLHSEAEDAANWVQTEVEESGSAQTTSDGKYRCRTCGQVFDSLEAHDEHRRKMHGEEKTIERSVVV